MVKGNYLLDIEHALSEGKKNPEILNMILAFLDFKPAEIRIYNLLLKKPQTIKQIEEQLSISERTIRKHINRLDQDGFIMKHVEQGRRLKYVYAAIPPTEVWKRLHARIQQMLDEITKVLKSKAFLL